MPVAKSDSKVPGSDPSFHQSKPYMSAMTYKGRRIMGFNASCRQNGCAWSAVYGNEEARDKAAARHRRDKVLEARRDFLVKRGVVKSDKMDEALRSMADKHSHTQEDWEGAVTEIWQWLTNKDPFQMPSYNREIQYVLGATAQEVAKKLVAGDI